MEEGSSKEEERGMEKVNEERDYKNKKRAWRKDSEVERWREWKE
jgi:hypothetical protein